MSHYPLHQYFIYNGKIISNTEFRASENTGGVYEVLRVSQGVPLFLKEHLVRFFGSASLAGKAIRFSESEIAGFLSALIRENSISEGNILLSCKTNLKAFFIPHKYPDEKWYVAGIPCGILKGERQNPNAKVFQTQVRQRADKLMAEKGFYEVLLVDNHNHVTEGSRSNIFFVSEGRLVTPPGKEVLLGITRQKTIQLAGEENILMDEKEIRLQDLPGFQAAFITGTSPKILPVSQIGEWKFDPQNYVVQRLRKKYDDLIHRYIKSHQT